MDIRPIRTADDHAKVLREIDALWGAESGTSDGDKLEILITLVDRYEDEHFPIEAAHPIDVIKTHMEMTGRRQADLAALIGSASRASEILNRRRHLTIDMVHMLHKAWGIPADCLVLPYELAPSQRRRA